jgi:transketolase
MQTYSMRKIYGETLVELGAINPQVVALDADLAGATMSAMFRDKYPERFVQCGIAEQNMMTVAAGLALCGKIPFVSTITVFLTMRACDQLRSAVAMTRANVKVCGHYSGLCTAENGATHQCIADVGITRAIPQLSVIAPADAHACRGLMHVATAHQGPLYMRVLRDNEPVVYDRETPESFEIGRGYRLREGSDITLMAHGYMVHRCQQAAEMLAKEGISASVVDMYSLKPIDEELILEEAERTGAILTVEEHNVIGGLGSAVAEVLSQKRPTLLRTMGLQDKYAVSGRYEDLLQRYGLTAENIAKQATAFISEAKQSVSA